MKDKNKKGRSRGRMNLLQRQQAYFKAFTAVITCYSEIKSVNGTMSCGKFYRHLAGEAGSSRGGLISVSLSDLVADVELAIKEIVGPAYLSNPDTDFSDLTDPQRERIGKQFMIRKIFPLHSYMKPKSRNDIRKNQ